MFFVRKRSGSNRCFLCESVASATVFYLRESVAAAATVFYLRESVAAAATWFYLRESVAAAATAPMQVS
ncbi:hypothetical protein [Lysinibacillus xylanilyticus]|uniref:hypothetical protein n=1 Tax=Lysinibacillus xylanilyticus TaxID=582475 RepID=UPI003D050857